MVQLLLKFLPQWRCEHAQMPVLTWSAFHHKTREFVNPLVSGESLRDILMFLHDMGEVISESVPSLVVVMLATMCNN